MKWTDRRFENSFGRLRQVWASENRLCWAKEVFFLLYIFYPFVRHVSHWCSIFSVMSFDKLVILFVRTFSIRSDAEKHVANEFQIRFLTARCKHKTNEYSLKCDNCSYQASQKEEKKKFRPFDEIVQMCN